MCVGALPLNLN